MSKRTDYQIDETMPKEIGTSFDDDEFDDSPWTKEEIETLAWEVGKRAGWEDMDEYDNIHVKAIREAHEAQRSSRGV